MNKKGVLAIIIVLVLAVCAFAYRQNFQQNGAAPSSFQRQKKKTASKLKSTASYNNDDWLIMGYLEYARRNYQESRHTHNTTELVKAVGTDLDTGALKIAKAGNSYTLSNKFGSVQGEVSSQAVRILGDNGRSFAKTDLQNTFSNYTQDIHQLARKIGERQTTSKAKSQQQTDSYSDKEIVTMAMVTWIKKSPAENVRHTMKNIDDSPKRTTNDYYQAFFHDKFGIEIALNPSTSAFDIFTINGDEVTSRPAGANLGANLHGKRHYYSKKQLIKDYGLYRPEIDQMIQKMEYYKKNVNRIWYHNK